MKRTFSRPFLFIGLAFVATVIIVAVLAYDTVRDLVAEWNGTNTETFNPVDRSQGPDTPGGSFLADFDPNAPVQPVGYPTPDPWDGNERVTILVMGLDYRGWEDGNGLGRTDTMILVTIDPETGSAGMLSVPRDLWVEIPGFSYGKLNTAFQTGEINRVDGGGPGLTMKSIEQLLGIDIHFYAMVDFNAFVTMVDEIGGVKINVPEVIEVDPLGDAPPKHIQPGIQTLPGPVALAYARARNTPGGDFDRSQRQQQVIIGIRDRIISFDMIPTLIARSPALYNQLAGGIRTNMTLDQAIRLLLLSGQISHESIQRGVIGEDQVTFDWSNDGQFILVPIPDQIRVLRDEIFTPNAAANPISVNLSPEELIENENANISLLNGTTVPGLAARTAEWLTQQGISVMNTGNADKIYAATTIVDFTGKPNTMQFLVDNLNVNPARIFHSYDPQQSVDIEIILGDDWANSGALP